jgi:hypothetical protein
VVSEKLNREQLAVFRVRQERPVEWPRLVIHVWVLLGQCSLIFRFWRRHVAVDSKWFQVLSLGFGNMQRYWLNGRGELRGRILLQHYKSSALTSVELNALLLALLDGRLRKQTVLRN